MGSRLLNLLLCALLLGPLSSSAWAIARPENRVGGSPDFSSTSASADLEQTAGVRRESRCYGYDFASGMRIYLYCQADPVNGVDPSGNEMIMEALDVLSPGYPVGWQPSVTQNPVVASKGANGNIVVHVWKYRGSKEAWGHASMTLKDGTHISWWPAATPRDSMPFLPQVYSAPANDPQTFQDDVRLEEQPPDVQITIKTLDEDKIKSWWIQFKPTHQWKTLSQNCSTTVGDGLKAGDATEAKGIWGTVRLQWTGHNLIWTPSDVEAFANAIVKYHKP